MYCSSCGEPMILKHQGKVEYSRRIHGLPFYTVNLYACSNLPAFIPWWVLLFLWPSRHDTHELAETTEIYKSVKAKYDKEHSYPLPNPGIVMRKVL